MPRVGLDSTIPASERTKKFRTLRRGYTKETRNRNATAISEKCYQTELNTWNWTEQCKLWKRQRDGNAIVSQFPGNWAARFDLGKNFSWDEWVWILVKFFRNNINPWPQIVTEERMHPKFYFPLSSLLTPSQPPLYCDKISIIIWHCRRTLHEIKIQSPIKSDERTRLRWCEQLIKHKFPQCAPPNLETSCLLEIGDVSWKLRLRCSCQFLWCALATVIGMLLILI
jgi:hypothetical protein